MARKTYTTDQIIKYIQKKVFVMIILTICNITYGNKSAAQEYLNENHGIGFKLYFPKEVGIYYDYNIIPYGIQIHLEQSNRSYFKEDDTGNEIITLDKYYNTLSIRKVFNFGFFAGVGVQGGQIRLDFNDPNLTNRIVEKDLHSNGLLELGWQGKDFYYFQISYRLRHSFKKAKSSNFDQIPDSNEYKPTVVDKWTEGINEDSPFMFGFGWYVGS